MKIVHVTAEFQPELGYEEYYLALNQRKLGHDVYVITTDVTPEIPNIKKEKIGFSEYNRIKIFRLKHLFKIRDFIYAPGMKKLLKKINPDIVHAHEARQLFPALSSLYKKELGYKLIVDQHDYDVFNTIKAKLFTLLVRKNIVRFAMRKADKIITITPEAINFLRNTYKIKEPIISLWLGADYNHFHFRENERKRLRKEIASNGEVVLITLGQIGRVKKLEMLIKAAKKFSNKYKIKLLIVGGGDEIYLRELKSLAENLDNITFIRKLSQDEIPSYYSAADIGVWPFRATITMIEAMACKLPIVIPNLNVVNHLIENNNGLNFEANNQQDFENAIEKLIKDKKLRKQMGKNSEEIVIKKFDYKIIAKILIEIYQDLLKK